MVRREIIEIDEEKCDGCGLCVPDCPEGALQLIDGKARLVGELLCDGLGACIGNCPRGAISVTEREAEPYDEKRVMDNIYPKGPNTILAHLKHLRDHGQTEYMKTALSYLEEKGFHVPEEFSGREAAPSHGGGCPGSRIVNFESEGQSYKKSSRGGPSALRHWPVQMHLISPEAPCYQGSDVILAADCVAFSLGDFHSKWLDGKSLAIACPKLDSGREIYVEKIRAMADRAKINTLTVMIMQVPCCLGLLEIAREALSGANRKVPLKKIIVGIRGDMVNEEWVSV